MNNVAKRNKMVSHVKENVPPTGSQGKNGRQVKKRLKGALAAFVDMPLDIMLCVRGCKRIFSRHFGLHVA